MIRRNGQRAFTLAELVTALLVFGLLASFAIVQLRTSAGSAAQALALYNTTQKMASSWRRLASNCGIVSTVTQSPLLASSSVSAIDVLVAGAPAVNSKFQACYQGSRLRPMVDSIRAGANGWMIQNFPFSLDGGGSQPFIAQFNAVPHDVTLNLAVKYGQLQGADLATQDLANPVIRYQADSAGTYTVWILIGAPDQLVLAGPPVLRGTTASPVRLLPAAPLMAISTPPANSPPSGLASPPAITPSPVLTPISLTTGGGFSISGGGTCTTGATSSTCASTSGGSVVTGGAATGTGSGPATATGSPAVAACLITLTNSSSGNVMYFPNPGCDVVDAGSGNLFYVALNLLGSMPADTSQYACIMTVSGTGNIIYIPSGPCQTAEISGSGNVISGSGNATSGSGNVLTGNNNTTSGSGNVAVGSGNNTGGSGNVLGGSNNTTSGTGNVLSGNGNDTSGTGNVLGGSGNTTSGSGNVTYGSNNTVSGTGNINGTSNSPDSISGALIGY